MCQARSPRNVAPNWTEQLKGRVASRANVSANEALHVIAPEAAFLVVLEAHRDFAEDPGRRNCDATAGARVQFRHCLSQDTLKSWAFPSAWLGSRRADVFGMTHRDEPRRCV